jgi:hypothetical protein
MCDKCDQIDERMTRYRRIAASIHDELTIERILELVKELEDRKAALHHRPLRS